MDLWKSDSALGMIAFDLGRKVIEMYDSCGTPIPTTYVDPRGPHRGSPSHDAQQTFIEMFILDAEDFTSLDPQKIIDEYQRMRQAADATGTESGADQHLGTARTKLAAGWHGEAAVAFAEQLENIGKFMDQQQERLVYAMQAMGTAFGLAVQFRQSYFDLAETTIEACRAVMAKHPDAPTVTSTMIEIGSELVKLGVGAVGAKSPKELAKVGIEWFKEEFQGAVKEKVSIDSSDAARVLDGYVNARSRLRGSFEDGLGQLGMWLDRQRGSYFSLRVPILEPLPASCDVRGPDFSYGKFFNDGHDATAYAPKVEQERKKFAEENPRPDGPIHRRLKGEE